MTTIPDFTVPVLLFMFLYDPIMLFDDPFIFLRDTFTICWRRNIFTWLISWCVNQCKYSSCVEACLPHLPEVPVRCQCRVVGRDLCFWWLWPGVRSPAGQKLETLFCGWQAFPQSFHFRSRRRQSCPLRCHSPPPLHCQAARVQKRRHDRRHTGRLSWVRPSHARGRGPPRRNGRRNGSHSAHARRSGVVRQRRRQSLHCQRARPGAGALNGS